MRYKTIKYHPDCVEAVDVPTMTEMTIEEYRSYLRDGLMFIDHHDVLRSEPAGYPIAVTQRQVDELINYLKEAKYRLNES